MDQIKIGKFLAELRKEKDLTQEQLAEKLNVARRTVSRWETGNNMPDMDILIELSDFYSVDLRDILDGERRYNKMDKKMEETVLKVAEYGNEGKRRSTIIVLVYFSLGIIALVANFIMHLMELDDTFLTGFLEGLTFTMALGAMILGIVYASGMMAKLLAFKIRLLKRENK